MLGCPGVMQNRSALDLRTLQSPFLNGRFPLPAASVVGSWASPTDFKENKYDDGRCTAFCNNFALIGHGFPPGDDGDAAQNECRSEMGDKIHHRHCYRMAEGEQSKRHETDGDARQRQ